MATGVLGVFRIVGEKPSTPTDAQWDLLQHVLPEPFGRGRPRKWPLRGLIDGVRYRVRAGCPWRDVPGRYGPWERMYALFASYNLGAWEHIQTALTGPWQGEMAGIGRLDHQPRPHPRCRRPPRLSAPGGHRTGRSRVWPLAWGLVHQDPPGNRLGPWRARLLPHPRTGQRQSRADHCSGKDPGPQPGWAPRRRPDRVLADRAYSSRANRLWLRRHHIKAPSPSLPTRPHTANIVVARAAGHPHSTRLSTRTGTRSNAVSTNSNTTGDSPPDTTNSPSATKPPPTSPSSTIGSSDIHNKP